VTHAVQRGEAQADLSLIRPFVFGTTRRISGNDAGVVYMPFTHVRASDLAEKRDVEQACSNGATVSSTPSGGFTTQIYYDAGCTVLWQLINGTQTATSGQATATATDTVYGQSGAQIEVDRVTVLYQYYQGGANLDISGTSGSDANTVRDTFSLYCASIPKGTACDPADLQYLATSDALPAVGASDVVTFTQSGAVDSAAYYAGTIAKTSLPYNTIEGASYSEPLEASENFTFDANNDPRLSSISTTDTVTGVSGIVTETSSAVTGNLTLTATGTVIAQYTLDINGSGSIQYADGSLATVTTFAIQK
jgi:hypothetical protein